MNDDERCMHGYLGQGSNCPECLEAEWWLRVFVVGIVLVIAIYVILF